MCVSVVRITRVKDQPLTYLAKHRNSKHFLRERIAHCFGERRLHLPRVHDWLNKRVIFVVGDVFANGLDVRVDAFRDNGVVNVLLDIRLAPI